MELKDFVDVLFVLYPNSYNSENAYLKKKQYLMALDIKNIDWEKMLDRIAKCHFGDYMPSSAWLREQTKNCYKKEFLQSSSQFVSVKVYNPIINEIINCDCFPKDLGNEEIIRFYEKNFGGCGWKVLEKTDY